MHRQSRASRSSGRHVYLASIGWSKPFRSGVGQSQRIPRRICNGNTGYRRSVDLALKIRPVCDDHSCRWALSCREATENVDDRFLLLCAERSEIWRLMRIVSAALIFLPVDLSTTDLSYATNPCMDFHQPRVIAGYRSASRSAPRRTVGWGEIATQPTCNLDSKVRRKFAQ